MQIITLQGKQYAAGLWWQVPTDTYTGRRELLQSARHSAAQQTDDKFNCVVLRKYQFGLGAFPLPKFQPLPALAAALRPKELPFLGLFCLPNDDIGPLWWVCCITKSGIIAGDGDKLYDDKNIALHRVRSLQAMFGDIPINHECNTSEESVKALAALLHSEDKLERLYTDPQQKRLGLAALAVLTFFLGGIYAYDYYTTQQAEQLRQAQMLALQKARESKRFDAQNNLTRYFSKDWEKAPTVRAVADQCLPALYATPAVAHGWVLDSATCQRGSQINTWVHTPGASYVLLPDGAVLQIKTPTQALSTHNLHLLAPRPTTTEQKLSSQAQISGQLYQITQDIGATVRLQWANAESKEVEGVVLVAPWVRCSWELASVPNAALAELVTALGNVPSLTIETITMQKNTWILKGYVYANR